MKKRIITIIIIIAVLVAILLNYWIVYVEDLHPELIEIQIYGETEITIKTEDKEIIEEIMDVVDEQYYLRGIEQISWSGNHVDYGIEFLNKKQINEHPYYFEQYYLMLININEERPIPYNRSRINVYDKEASVYLEQDQIEAINNILVENGLIK